MKADDFILGLRYVLARTKREFKDWGEYNIVEIKECKLEPGMLVDVSKEIKKHVTSFKKFRFVKKTIDKELERLNYALIDKENGVTYRIED